MTAMKDMVVFHKWDIPNSWMVYSGKSAKVPTTMDDLGVAPAGNLDIFSAKMCQLQAGQAGTCE
jgi:hypothetical protein